MAPYSSMAASHFPKITSKSRTGEVASNSMVPLRFSSANNLMVIMGIRNNPITLTFESRGRITCSFRFIGKLPPRICDSMPV